MWTIFHWASAITIPELVEIKLVSDDDDSLTDRKSYSTIIVELVREVKCVNFHKIC